MSARDTGTVKPFDVIEEIRGTNYVVGDRVDLSKPHPINLHQMECSNGCGFKAIFDNAEVSYIVAQQARPLCVPCAEILSGNKAGRKGKRQGKG